MTRINQHSKFNPQTVGMLFEALRTGADIKTSCSYAGITTTTFGTWKRRGLLGEEPFKTFAIGVERAVAEFKVSNLQTIQAHSSTRWEAAAWLLERRDPQQFGQRTYVETESPLELELIELVQTATISVAEIKEQMPQLSPTIINRLQAVEAEIVNVTD